MRPGDKEYVYEQWGHDMSDHEYREDYTWPSYSLVEGADYSIHGTLSPIMDFVECFFGGDYEALCEVGHHLSLMARYRLDNECPIDNSAILKAIAAVNKRDTLILVKEYGLEGWLDSMKHLGFEDADLHYDVITEWEVPE